SSLYYFKQTYYLTLAYEIWAWSGGYDTLHLKKDIKLIDRSIHEGATQYIHDVLYDYRTEFVAVVLANIVPQSGRVDLKEEQIVSFDVSIYNGDWQKQQSFHFNAQEYSPYSIYLIQNNMYVEKYAPEQVHLVRSNYSSTLSRISFL
ncbi:hypothetical protein, partial [Myroides odoratimimus]|uniref:hypothetical protein n=1 Tax=Myroides odoratimimus TaxID=76832 RepID=UPI003F4214B6